jgi:hypothetical protein
MSKKSVHEVLTEMVALSQTLSEGYIFDDKNEDEMGIDPSLEDDLSMGQTEDKVNQIRELALSGIQEYAQDVDSKEYDFFKKVWLMCDKVCSEKEEKKGEI